MLKIGKGLKKKKKSKKHKEEELFTEEELEEYRKKHSQKEVEETGETSEPTPTQQDGGSEEFEKFKQLTAGVDDILKKSQGDLDRIKKESFFQRKPTPSELKALEEKEKQALRQTEENLEKEKLELAAAEEKEEESESEYEFDDKDDIFDTTYVEALESGEVKLVYVPEDDEIIKAGEPDPFDTTSVDELLKKAEEVEKKKKLEISLGLAVNVLTGRAERDKSVLEETGAIDLIEKTNLPASKPRKRPRKIQDFVLIGSFDESNNVGPLPPSENVADRVAEAPRSLLDDDLDIGCPLPEGDALITEVLIQQQAHKVPQVPEENILEKGNDQNLKNLVSEFDIIKEEVTPEVRKAEEVEDEFDEFTALAESSVANQKLEEELQQFENAEDDPFDTTTASIILKEETADPFGAIDAKIPAPQTIELTQVHQKWSAFDSEKKEEEKELDPFDTSFAAQIQPGKCELKLLESEILGDIVETAHKSDVHLEARILSRNNSDSDFNPREGEEPPKLCNQNFNHKVSIQITDPSGFVETQRGSESESRDGDFVSLGFQHRDLLGGSTTDLTKLGNEPLPPEVESPVEDFSKYSDPFDTSIVEQVALPGKAELKFLEKELLSDIPRVPDEDTLSDIDFDPRKEENVGQKVSFDIPSPITSDLLSTAREGPRPLTPFYAEVKDNESDTFEVEDPFDTSHVTSLPGKEELKLIEKELDNVQISEAVLEPIHKKLGLTEDITTSTGLKHSLSDPDFNPREDSEPSQINTETSSTIRRYSDVTGLIHKPPTSLSFQPAKPDLLLVEEEHPVKALTPAVEEDISSYIDPFDTSIAENIAPGKAELKLLESELITGEGGIKRSYTDPDFNPRDEITPETVPVVQQDNILNLKEDSTITAKPLSPLDFETSTNEDEIDPFDTSIATNLLPGKAEIRILESELFGQ